MGDERERLLRKNKFQRSISYAQDELQSFRSWLRWMCVDQSTISTGCLSWSVFILLAIAVPVMSHFLLACSSCDAKHQRPYDAVVQLSLSSVAVLSFLCLSRFIRNYGLRRFLFFDKLRDESEMVRKNYTEQLNVSFSSSIRCVLVGKIEEDPEFCIFIYFLFRFLGNQTEENRVFFLSSLGQI